MRFGGVADLIEHVEAIGSLGLDFAEVQLQTEGALITHLNKLIAMAKEWNLTYLVHAREVEDPWDVCYLEEVFFREIISVLSACQDLSAPILTIHFWMDRRFIPEKTYDRKRDILFSMAKKASNMGVQLCLETLGEPVEDIYPLLQGCPELALTMDIGHGQLLTDRNRSFDYLERCPDRIRHVHAHDNRGGNRVEDDLHLPIGEGMIDFHSLFRALLKVQYQETVTLEIPHQYLEASVQKLRQLVNSLVE